MHSSIGTTYFPHVSVLYTSSNVYSIVGVKRGKKFPSYTSIGCYPIVYLSKRGQVRCAECATSNDDSSNPTMDAGIHWEGEAHICDDCGCEIESAYG